jgi:hypothetical protein
VEASSHLRAIFHAANWNKCSFPVHCASQFYWHGLCLVWSVSCFPVTVASYWQYLTTVVPNIRSWPKFRFRESSVSGLWFFSVQILSLRYPDRQSSVSKFRESLVSGFWAISEVTKVYQNICLPILMMKSVRIVRRESWKVTCEKFWVREKNIWNHWIKI